MVIYNKVLDNRARIAHRDASEINLVFWKTSTSSPAHLFAIRGRRKRVPGTLQTRD